MSGFYGGREGRSFVITKEFQTITEMVENFSKGPSYNEVHFDEYVLINTLNKNNPENGQLFRRGYDFDTDRTISSYQLGRDKEGKTFIKRNIPAGGAVYVGTIVGPAGKAPTFNFNLYDDVVALTDVAILDNPAITDGFSSTEEMINYLVTQFGDGNVPYDVNKKVVQSGTGEDIVGYSQYVKLIKTDGAETFNYYFYYDKLLYVETPEATIKWFLLDTPPITGEDKYDITNGHMLPGVVYKKNADGSLYYQVDADGSRHLVPESYQDSIDWAYVTMRNENNEDSTAYVGFKFGYSVFEIEAETVSAYINRSDNPDGTGVNTHKFNNVNLIEKIDTSTEGKEHPFYHKWKVSIPKGIKGESINHVYLVDASKSHNVEKFILDNDGNLTYNEIGEIQVEPYVEDMTMPANSRDHASSTSKWIIVYDYVCYDRLPEGERHTIYLGDFNKLDGIHLEHYGELVFDYSHDNTQRTPQEDWLHWIDKMKFEDNGTVTVTFNDNSWNVANGTNQDKIENGVLTKSQLINWITNVDFADNGTVTVDFNNNNLFNGQLVESQLITWMTGFSLDEETGLLTVTFNNNRLIQNISKNLQWVKDIVLAEDGTLTTDYTSIANRVESKKINWIKSCDFNSDTGRLQIVMNNDNYANIDKTLNYIQAVERDTNQNSATYNHLLIHHSDPAKQVNGCTYNGIEGWQDLGGLSYMMAHADDGSAELQKQKDALCTSGVWFITKEV